MIVAKVATLPRSQDPRRRIGARLSARPEALQEEVPENSSGSFELSLPGGRKLRVPSDVQPEALAKLLEVLDPDGVATPLSSAQPATQNVRKLRGG
jgi:hypothetical protein